MFSLFRDVTRSEEVEALSRYVDALLGRGPLPPGAIADAYGSLLTLLRADMLPREPDPVFVDNLRMRLIAAADQRAPALVAVSSPLVDWRQPRFLIGAAGVVSAAAVIALVARNRMQSRAAAAA